MQKKGKPAPESDFDSEEVGADASSPEGAELPAGFDTRVHGQGAQQSLFEQSELIIPETLKNFRKSVAAVYAVPVKSDGMTKLMVRRIMDGCIMAVQLDCKARGSEFVRRIEVDRVSPIFEVRITTLAELAGIPGKNYKRVYDALNELFEIVMRWNMLGEDKTVDFQMQGHFFSMLGFGQGPFRGLIRFSIDPSVLGFVIEPSIWASLSLGVMRNLRTSPSYALFQAVWRYVGTPSRVTAALPTHVWIELMLGESRYVVTLPDGSKRVDNYSDFKRRFLLDSVERINSLLTLNNTIELKEFKSGPRVVKLQFKFIPRIQKGLDLPLVWPEELKATLRSVGLSDTEIQDIASASSKELVSDALIRLKAAEDKKRQLGQPLFDRRRYFQGILSNIGSGAKPSEITEADIEREVRERENAQSKEDRERILQEKFEEHVKARFKEGFEALAQADRERLVAAFMKTPDGERAQVFLKEGWELKPLPAAYMAVFRGWMVKAKPKDFQRVMPDVQDRIYEDWLAWRAAMV